MRGRKRCRVETKQKKWDDENLFVCWEGVSVKTQVNGAINQKVNLKVFLDGKI